MEQITLADALSQRNDLQKRLSALEERLKNNSKVQEGEEPSENPQELMESLKRMCERMEWLELHLNLTNAKTMVEGQSLTQMLARRDALKMKKGTLENLLEHLTNYNERRYDDTVMEMKVDTDDLRKRFDDTNEELTALELKIQGVGYVTMLM